MLSEYMQSSISGMEANQVYAIPFEKGDPRRLLIRRANLLEINGVEAATLSSKRFMFMGLVPPEQWMSSPDNVEPFADVAAAQAVWHRLVRNGKL